MKAKKKLLIGTAIAALAAGGASAVSTMAWYSTTAAKGAVAMSATAVDGVTTQASGAVVDNLQIKLIVTPTAAEEGKVVLTTKDGYTLGVAGGKVVDAVLPSGGLLYGSFSLSIEAYDSTGARRARGDEIAQLATNTTGIQMRVTAGARTKVTSTNPGGATSQSNFSTAFNSLSRENHFDVTVTWVTGQTTEADAFSISPSTGYYCVGGDATNDYAKSSYELGTTAAVAETAGEVKASFTTGAKPA